MPLTAPPPKNASRDEGELSSFYRLFRKINSSRNWPTHLTSAICTKLGGCHEDDYRINGLGFVPRRKHLLQCSACAQTRTDDDE
jgi:hypothetical protein